jgi:thiol-disulfide isomerase/thioredoxin
MKSMTGLFLVLLMLSTHAQEPLLKPGSRFPDLVIANISNAPVKEFYLNKAKDNTFYILNFWGTWCSPCIPEMDALAKLQRANAGKVQVIAISDDSEERKRNYLKNKPSSIWLATDTAYTLYNMFNLSSVGQSAIIDPGKKIVALVRTDSIDQRMIDKLLKGDTVKMSAGFKEAAIPTGHDIFGVDSLMQHSFSISGYKKGQPVMSRVYPTGPFKERRATWINLPIGTLYRAAYGIFTYKKQEFYEASVSESEVNGEHGKMDNSTSYCVDLLVKPGQKDSLYIFLRQYLNGYLPVKARPEKRKLGVYVLKKIPGATITIQSSAAQASSYGFSGRGYEGTRVTLADFASKYLANELGLPVVDETGLEGYYDIATTVELRNAAGIIKSIETLGLMIEKAEREMNVIVYYK